MKKYLPILILLGCAAAFAFGVIELFELRFEKGDVYPAYSSLRTDPLGSMAFYESLVKMPGVSVSRDFNAFNRLPTDPDSVYLHLAGEQYEWEFVPDDLYQEVVGFLGRGGRLVITFFPRTEASTYQNDAETNSASSPRVKQNTHPSDQPVKKKKKSDEEEEDYVSLQDKWHFYPIFKKLNAGLDSYAPVPVTNQTSLALPPTLLWHSGIVFSNTDNSWQAIYTRGTNAVVMERHFGRGSVVLVSDSYFVSNEAMAMDRHADLLAWLLGSHRQVCFDEAHLGIVDNSGVATLMRKYRLHGLAAGLLLLAALLIWKNATSLVPPLADEKSENVIAGKDSAAGFVNLLRRSIPPAGLLATCFSEWKKSGAPKGGLSATRRQQAEAIFAAEESLRGRERNPISAYRNISAALGKHNPP